MQNGPFVTGGGGGGENSNTVTLSCTPQGVTKKSWGVMIMCLAAHPGVITWSWVQLCIWVGFKEIKFAPGIPRLTEPKMNTSKNTGRGVTVTSAIFTTSPTKWLLVYKKYEC